MRIIAHIEWRPELDPETPLDQHEGKWESLLEPMFERAVALGGRVIGWGRRSITVDFLWDGLYDSVDFLVDAPLAPELSAGLCAGEPKIIYDGLRLAFAVGPALGKAAALAELARPGEVLVSPELVRDAGGRLGTAGEVGSRPGRPAIRAFVLDPVSPILESEAPEPLSRRDALELVPSVVSYHPPSSRSPESERARHVDRLVSVTEALGDAAPAVFPAEITAALRKRDAASLQQLAKTVRANHALESAERLDAMAELAGGKSGEALRRLRASKEKSLTEDPSTRCRAALALAVALSAAGRPYQAALEALDGVARARQGGDRRGELACARFLSQLALTLGDNASADAWGKLESA
jgi:hypothetical protein